MHSYFNLLLAMLVPWAVSAQIHNPYAARVQEVPLQVTESGVDKKTRFIIKDDSAMVAKSEPIYMAIRPLIDHTGVLAEQYDDWDNQAAYGLRRYIPELMSYNNTSTHFRVAPEASWPEGWPKPEVVAEFNITEFIVARSIRRDEKERFWAIDEEGVTHYCDAQRSDDYWLISYTCHIRVYDTLGFQIAHYKEVMDRKPYGGAGLQFQGDIRVVPYGYRKQQYGHGIREESWAVLTSQHALIAKCCVRLYSIYCQRILNKKRRLSQGR